MSKKGKKKKYAIRTPLTVKGGIRAQLSPAGGSRVWWARRWTEMMEDFRIGARLGRGRNYAVSGQVSALNVSCGRVEADVQGASDEPYHCVILFRRLEDDARDRILLSLRSRPILLARLLAGEMPFEMEALFRENGAPFFPRKEGDVQSRCSCPDYANPCKHLAAVYYLLGEAFSKNPRLLPILRGLPLPEWEPRAAAEDPGPRAEPPSELAPAECYGRPRDPLPPSDAPQADGSEASLPARLGPLPFWRGQERFLDTLAHLYARAAPRGRIVWAGDTLDLRHENEKTILTGARLKLNIHRPRIDLHP